MVVYTCEATLSIHLPSPSSVILYLCLYSYPANSVISTIFHPANSVISAIFHPANSVISTIFLDSIYICSL